MVFSRRNRSRSWIKSMIRSSSRSEVGVTRCASDDLGLLSAIGECSLCPVSCYCLAPSGVSCGGKVSWSAIW